MTHPSPQGAVPEGAFVGTPGQSNSITNQLNNLDENGAKAQMRGLAAPSFNRQRDGQWDLIQSMIDMFTGNYTGDIPPFVDGQEAINDRLLLGKSGYCSVVMEQGFRIGPGRNRALPFNKMLGPNQDAELVTVSRQHPGTGSTFRNEACVRLDREGLWDAKTFFSHGGDGYNNGYAEIAVLRPDLTVYSLSTLPLTQGKSGVSAPNGGDPVVIPTSFVVPEPGYYVQVRWQFSVTIGQRTVRGGSRYNRLIVEQWSERVENDEASEEQTGVTDDTSTQDP